MYQLFLILMITVYLLSLKKVDGFTLSKIKFINHGKFIRNHYKINHQMSTQAEIDAENEIIMTEWLDNMIYSGDMVTFHFFFFFFFLFALFKKRKNENPKNMIVSYIYLSIFIFHFISLHFISLHFISLHFISFHFLSLHFISLPFISLHFT